MKRLTAWLTGVAGGVAAARIFRRPPAPAHVVVHEPDPAEELRSKLAETKAAAPEAPPDDDPDARRRAVHERGRAAVDEMRGDRTSE
ncbi:MAG TPA: hypothetical protein VHQ89_08800 [Gaiellaceae bacterium]|jgi:hypothetical protein|nr:hypothetical protein [Gaiellaceae bacterium]